jgi:sugar phosphate isomerase/epimerase
VVRIMSIIGFKAIDIGAFTGWANFDAADLAARDNKIATDLKRIKAEHGMTYTDLIVSFNGDLAKHALNDPDPAVRDATLETVKGLCAFCRNVGVPGITLLPGVMQPALGRDGSLEVAIEQFARHVAVARDHGLRMSFEPHVDSITEKPNDALRVVEQVDGLTFTLDYSHFAYQGYSDDDVEPLLPHTGHFHVRQASKGQCQCRTSEGSIDFPRALRRLKEMNYAGYVAFEYVWEQWMDNDRVDVICETLQLKKQISAFLAD